MPYESSPPALDHPELIQTLYRPTGGAVITGPIWAMSYRKEGSWIRAGQNRTNLRGSVCKRYPGPMKLVSVELPLGPRLPYKVFSKKAGRMVWARKPIKVWKLKRDRTKVVYSKGLNIPPNPLNYRFAKMTILPNSDRFIQSTNIYDDRYQKHWQGDLYDSIVPPGGSSALPCAPDLSFLYAPDFQGTIDNLERRCTEKLYGKVKNSHVNLLNALAERKQTISTLANLIKRLVTACLMLKKANLAGALQVMFPTTGKGAANDWLMIQYGLKPLISDINGVIDHLKEWEPLTFDVKVKSKEVLPTTVEEYSFNSGIAMSGKKKTQTTVTVIYKVRLHTKDNFARNLTRLGLTNLNATAWELIPFSFIFDWVFSISDYLNNKDAFTDLSVEFCSRSIFIKQDIELNRSFGGVDLDGYNWASAKSGVVVQKVLANRELVTIPVLRYPLPKNPFSTGHVLNLAALITQLRK